ncbi:GerW family sporulation protein [Methanimicrococcus blatticola]|uniref:Sporulation protein YtfJ n=1 Tax=Methanimicrococcus blatticola TaxID=91560 RepID=A0A484F6T1_9EURY|nr:spore germination protein GerW family protein [Methanimicrococcus blatticola]MBZ3936196.1 sporulation protein [Methanimicrococcus blatticola]MCC2508439.1 sporulation protein [Methanimicrococcus blatticola]TDQ70108.1 sporulation protein YtfJ [Methanimicrococcus blatticola]
MTIQDVISEVTNELEKIVSAQTVIGDPIITCGKTLIPVTRLSVGFASGGFEAGSKSGSELAKAPYGGGGGAGARVEPVAFIVIDGDKTEILTLNESRLEDEIVRFLGMVPSIIDKVKTAKKEKEPKARIIEVDDGC